MSEIQTIEQTLRAAGRRRRWARGLRGLWIGLLIGASLTLIVTAVYRVAPIPLWMLQYSAFLPFPCMAAGLILGAWRKPALPEVARWVDGKQQLQERFSTALELANQPEFGSWRDLVVADAAHHARQVDPRALQPFTLPRAAKWGLLVLALGAGLGFVPEYRSKSYLQKQADQQNIKEAGRQLADLTRRSLEQRPPALEPTQKALENVGELGTQLTKQTLTRSEALRDLASAAEKLKDQLREFGKDPALRKMEQASRNAGGADSQSASGLQKQMEQLQKQMGGGAATPEQLDTLKQELEKLQQAARGMSDNASAGTEADKQKMADSLAAMAKQAQDMGIQLPQLDEAVEALAANQAEMFLKDIQSALTDLEKLRDMSKALQQLQAQAQKLGKDLAEQLQNGQADAAQSTLKKMASQLQTAGLTPEQLQKMLEEVSKAVSPAKNYGKVADHLKTATTQMQTGDKPGAAQSLAAAAKELEQLMQQLADAEQIMGSLQDLAKAAQCIGTGQGWQAGRRPGYKPGGNPGAGVGTWADDENGEWDGESTAGWDNSGIERPDEDARGLTDRGEGELVDGLKPTQVKGSFSQGGQMPSITLKGVSIKGQSKVAYEEAAAAAQSDARSALTQEKVPRAYQESVRQYFDDLKN